MTLHSLVLFFAIFMTFSSFYYFNFFLVFFSNMLTCFLRRSWRRAQKNVQLCNFVLLCRRSQNRLKCTVQHETIRNILVLFAPYILQCWCWKSKTVTSYLQMFALAVISLTKLTKQNISLKQVKYIHIYTCCTVSHDIE